jgi:hypothetical protein
MNPLVAYFHAEKTESLGFLGAGFAGIAIAIFWWTKTSSVILDGAGWPLFFVGLAQLIIGSVVYLRTDSQVSALQTLARESSDAFRLEELERMHRVSQNFIRIRWTEIALFITSGIMLMMFIPTMGFWFGFALALAFESSISLTFDFFAEERALHYREFVKRVG